MYRDGRENADDPVFDTLLYLIRTVKTGKKNGRKDGDPLKSYVGEKEYSIWNARYLLGQMLRQYSTPRQNRYVSQEAIKLWKRICGSRENIDDYYYQKKVVCECGNVDVNKYVGNSTKPKETVTLKKGDAFSYREVFHDEHMIPISRIIDRLLNLENPTRDEVAAILDTICVCKITKDENSRLGHSGRGETLDQIFSYYRNHGIEVVKLYSE